jgi:hypothetical protein
MHSPLVLFGKTLHLPEPRVGLPPNVADHKNIDFYWVVGCFKEKKIVNGTLSIG